MGGEFSYKSFLRKVWVVAECLVFVWLWLLRVIIIEKLSSSGYWRDYACCYCCVCLF